MTVRQRLRAGLALCLGLVAFGMWCQGHGTVLPGSPLRGAAVAVMATVSTAEGTDHTDAGMAEEAPTRPACAPGDGPRPEAAPAPDGWPRMPSQDAAVEGLTALERPSEIGPSQCLSARPPPYALAVLRI